MNEATAVANIAWLQYGAFGALILVLGAVGFYVNRQTERQNARDVSRETWMKEMVEADREERRRRTDEMTELVRASIEAQRATVESLNGLQAMACEIVTGLKELAKDVAEHEKGSQQRHRELGR